MSDSVTPAELPNLRSLVGHREFVRSSDTLEQVHARFAASKQDFLAVLTGRQLLGLCARRDVGILLGGRYGFALHARAPVELHLSSGALRLTADQPLPEVLQAVASRRDEHFYDDVLLVDAEGDFLGLIYVRELVRLQTTMLLGNIAELEARQKEIKTKNRQMEDDLRMAREVQTALLPREFPECRTGAGSSLRFAQLFEPAGGVSGDFFDVFPVSEHAAGLIVCDVMGHGVRSALVTAMVRTAIEELRPGAADAGAFLTQLNGALTRLLRRAGELIFVTATFLVVDAATGRLRHAHAGHPAPLCWRARLRRVEALPETRRIGGPALGLIDDHVYETAEIEFAPGDRVLAFTDGLVEAANAADEEFGDERLAGEFARGGDTALEVLLPRLRDTARAFTGGAAFADDVCLLACELRS